MKAKNLLNLGMMLACGTAAQAQTPVFHEGFDAAQTKSPEDVAFYEYINSIENANGNDERTINTSESYAGGGCLNFFNVAPDGSDTDGNHDGYWMRAVKFRNLPLEEGKSYRLKFRFKGSNTWINTAGESPRCRMNVALMQGGENADIPLLDAKGNEFRYEISYFNPDAYETYTRMFHFANKQLQYDKYAEQYPDREPLVDKYFATFNVMNPGDFYLDEVDLVESPIAGVAFQESVIRVDFGFQTNAAALASANPLGLVRLPIDCVSVTVNGQPITIVAVELHKDGKMYIYQDYEAEVIPDDAQVEVSFNNPEDPQYQVLYTGDLAPEGAVPSFTGEAGEFNDVDNISGEMSYDFREPLVTSISPVDGSFGLDETMTEVTFTFDRNVLLTDADDAPLSCVVNDSEELVLASTEISNTLTFKRADGKPFTKGAYSVVLNGVTSEMYMQNYNPIVVNFETGKIQVATETFTEIARYDFSADSPNTIPVGWTVNNEGEIRESGSSVGTGPRLLGFAPGGDVTNALYLRNKIDETTGDATEGYAVMNDCITLPAGDLRIQFLGFCWKGSGLKVKGEILNEAGEVVAEQSGLFETNVNGSTGMPVTADRITVAFKNEVEGQYKFRLTLIPNGNNWIEPMFAGVVVNDYKKTAGESTESELALEDKVFGGPDGLTCEDNCAPKAGSGWHMYHGNTMREQGGNFNYNGSRVFELGIKNLSKGYYGGNGDLSGNWIIFGEADNEPKLTLAPGRYQFTYYAANWKEVQNGGDHELYFELGKKDGEAVYNRTDIIKDCDLNGNRSANVSAVQIQFVYNITEETDYTVKFSMNKEMFVGNLKIEKLGSQAAYYMGQVNNMRTLAEEELALCEDALYDGTAKTAITEAIEKYKDPSVLHTPEEVTAALTELESATKAMAVRREHISRYATALTEAANLLSELGEKPEEGEDPGHPATKYASLDAFKNLEKVYNEYKEQEAKSLENESLVYSVTQLENNATWLKNMRDICVGLLTEQIVNAAQLLSELDPESATNEYVIAAGNALTDDQNIAQQLQLRITKAIYDKCAAGDPFSIYDIENNVTVESEMNLTSYIQNANIYTTETAQNRVLTTPENVPGWNIETINGSAGVEFSWVGFDNSELKPLSNRYLIAGWNTELDINQTVKNLPAGKYRYVSGTQDRGFEDNCENKTAALAEKEHWTVEGNSGTGEIFSYIYWKSGDVEGKKAFDITNQGQYYGLTDTSSDIFSVAAGENGMGEAVIGTHPISYQSTGSVDSFRLYMVGKDENFDYAAASAKVAQTITAIEEVAGAPEGEPVKVVYYDANGAVVATPSGMTIKVAYYKNGYMKVSKVFVK